VARETFASLTAPFKSEAKTLTLNKKIARMRDFNVLVKLFQKFVGCGVKPHGFNEN